MKKLLTNYPATSTLIVILIVLFSLALINTSNSETGQALTPRYYIGIGFSTEENYKTLLEKGQMLIFPYDKFEDGLDALAKEGLICNQYGHRYTEGTCGVCERKE